MQENLDKVSLSELVDIYNEVSAMIKSLDEREKQIVESEKK